MSGERRATGFHLATIAAVAVGYILVRIVVAPTVGPVRGHATDLLAGIALPSLLALVLPVRTELGRWAQTFVGKLALTASAAFVWEVAVPLVDAHSTPDPLDVLAYLAGTAVQHTLTRIPARAAAR